jgi:hypothetical protein
MSLHQGNMKLVWYPKIDHYMLFDVGKDPCEMNDLASNPEYAGIVAKLKGGLEQKQRLYRDPMVTGEVGNMSE